MIKTIALTFILATAACSTAAAQVDSATALGSLIRIRFHSLLWEPRSIPENDVELIAVDHERMWFLRERSLRTVSRDAVSSVRVNRQKLGAGAVFGYSVAFGAITGVVLAGACSSVEDAGNCGAVIPISVLLSLIVGAIAAPSYHSARFETVQWEQLRPHARFPQGLPDDVTVDQLVTTGSAVVRNRLEP